MVEDVARGGDDNAADLGGEHDRQRPAHQLNSKWRRRRARIGWAIRPMAAK
jgi:hypothetical protein